MSERLDVLHERRHTVDAALVRTRRHDAWFRQPAGDARDERGLLTGHISVRSGGYLDEDRRIDAAAAFTDRDPERCGASRRRRGTCRRSRAALRLSRRHARVRQARDAVGAAISVRSLSLAGSRSAPFAITTASAPCCVIRSPPATWCRSGSRRLRVHAAHCRRARRVACEVRPPDAVRTCAMCVSRSSGTGTSGSNRWVAVDRGHQRRHRAWRVVSVPLIAVPLVDQLQRDDHCSALRGDCHCCRWTQAASQSEVPDRGLSRGVPIRLRSRR